jgi:hypothetical protein
MTHSDAAVLPSLKLDVSYGILSDVMALERRRFHEMSHAHTRCRIAHTPRNEAAYYKAAEAWTNAFEGICAAYHAYRRVWDRARG